MGRLLYIEASPRQESSVSSRAAAEFLAAYREARPGDEIDHLALFRDPLPAFGREAAEKKMQQIAQLMQGGEGIAAEGEWAGVVREIERIKAADKVLISSPMWNFSIPWALKQYLDIICQPGLTFYVNQEGEYVGMLTGRPMQLILSSGSEYAMRFPLEDDGTKTDFQRVYLEHAARFIGFEDIRCIKLQPASAQPRIVEPMLAEKMQEARRAGAAF